MIGRSLVVYLALKWSAQLSPLSHYLSNAVECIPQKSMSACMRSQASRRVKVGRGHRGTMAIKRG